MNVSSNSVENVTGCKQFKNTFSSAVDNVIDVDVSHTTDGCSLSHQSRLLNIYSKLTNIVTDAKIGLQEMKRNSPDKFDAHTYIIGNHIDIILITETELDDTYSTAQFFIKGYSASYKKDRTGTGGGILLFIQEDVPSRVLNP